MLKPALHDPAALPRLALFALGLLYIAFRIGLVVWLARLVLRASRAAADPMPMMMFAFASYNAGPGNISKMRKEAAKRGLDPDQWFNNVEIVTARKIGIETTTYVRNIYKYYVAYRFSLPQIEGKAAAIEAAQP